MGEFITVPTSLIKPSQDYLKKGTLGYILECIKTGNLKDLPPTPIVRKGEKKGEYVAIDGHNLIAVYDEMGLPCEVYVASSRDDGLSPEPNNESIKSRNKDLFEKFDKSLSDSLELTDQGISSFSSLRQKYLAGGSVK